MKPDTAFQPCFDPNTDVQPLTYIPQFNLWRDTEPGFDANFAAEPEHDWYPLETGAEVWLVAAEDMQPAFYVEYQGQYIRVTGDRIPLGTAALHRHVRWTVDGGDPLFDPLRTVWWGVFLLEDRGGTGYTPSAPFTVKFAIAECEAGDVDGNGVVDFNDINPFVRVLTDPAAATLLERCAADANRDGYVNFRDINAFVGLLTS
ncbi:MAG: dockerin type I domain-containing protein [Planctomycetota bacterium]